MTELPPLTFQSLAESTLLIRFGDGMIAPATVEAVWALTAALDADAIPGILDVVPAYATILISFDAEETDGARLETAIRALAASVSHRPSDPPREVEIPVVYGGGFGLDLDHVAGHTGLSPEEVIARHATATYRVACGGFAPGWDYLMGLPLELSTPRLANPRTRVPPGSVGIGGAQTGVYPLETPGGWNLIGRTPLRLFDPEREAPFLLHPGDQVTFRRIGEDEFVGNQQGSLNRREIPRPSGKARNDGNGESAIRVVQPGMMTTVQDLGRAGLGRYGVAPGGALDRTALILGNRLVGNEPDEAGFEITLLGPTLTFAGPAIIALTGADLGARLNGNPVPLWRPFAVRAGDEVTFRPDSRQGARAYLCVAGGLVIEPVMGSRSTDLVGHFGGWEGRALQAGDELPLRGMPDTSNELLRRRLRRAPPAIASELTARVTLGPQQDRFTAGGIETFLGSVFSVSAKGNRTGVRLSGPAVDHADNADLVSEGIAHGAVQVPGDGQPIVLLAARQTVGGYVKIATVIGADLDHFAQLRPSATVRFTEIGLDEARAAAARYRRALGPDAIVAAPATFRGWKPGTTADQGDLSVASGEAWTPAGVVEVIEAATAAGVTSLKLDVAAAGLSLELHRAGNGALVGASPRIDESEEVITAPVLGVFYRRAAPDQPVLVEEGAAVTAGQPIAVIEVMKTYHEVRAPRTGTIPAFLIEDGRFVEYGEPLARLKLPV